MITDQISIAAKANIAKSTTAMFTAAFEPVQKQVEAFQQSVKK